MNKLGLLALASQFAPRLFQIRRGTWIGIGVGLVVLCGLFVWTAVALVGWLLGQAQGWLGAAQDAAAGPALGYVQSMLSVNRDAETHAYTKGAKRYHVTVTRSGRQQASVRIEAKRP